MGFWRGESTLCGSMSQNAASNMFKWTAGDSIGSHENKIITCKADLFISFHSFVEQVSSEATEVR